MCAACKRPSPDRNREAGGVLVLLAISLVVLLALVALVVDLGWAYVNRNELQNISDGSSLAATRELGHRYQMLAPPEQASFTCYGTCAEEIRAVAKAVAEKNQAGNVTISLLDDDIRIGVWEDGVFTETGDQPDAVEVTSRRDESINTPVPTFFARIMGIESTSVSSIATAALTGQGTTGEGEILFPVTLSEYFFEALPGEDRCNDYIKFNPTNDPESCGGWTTWDDKSNANLLRDILDGDDVSPAMSVNDSRIWTTGGDVATAFPNMLMLFQRMGCASTAETEAADRTFLIDDNLGDDPESWITWPGCVTWDEARIEPLRWYDAVDKEGQFQVTPWEEDGVQTYYPDPDFPNQDDLDAPRYFHMWETSVPVYDYAEGGAEECSNPSSRTKWLVVGFAPVVITDVWGPPDNTIIGRVICNRYSPYDTRGGGGDYGIKGSIPGLVR